MVCTANTLQLHCTKRRRSDKCWGGYLWAVACAFVSQLFILFFFSFFSFLPIDRKRLWDDRARKLQSSALGVSSSLHSHRHPETTAVAKAASWDNLPLCTSTFSIFFLHSVCAVMMSLLLFKVTCTFCLLFFFFLQATFNHSWAFCLFKFKNLTWEGHMKACVQTSLCVVQPSILPLSLFWLSPFHFSSLLSSLLLSLPFFLVLSGED